MDGRDARRENRPMTASSVRVGWVLRTLVLVFLVAALAYVAASFALELVI